MIISRKIKFVFETPYLHAISGDDGLVRVGVWWTGGQHVESNFLRVRTEVKTIVRRRCFLTKIDVYHRRLLLLRVSEFPATFDINSGFVAEFQCPKKIFDFDHSMQSLI